MTEQDENCALIQTESQSLSPTSSMNNAVSLPSTPLIATNEIAVPSSGPQSVGRKRLAGSQDKTPAKKPRSKAQEQKKNAIEANKKEVDRIQFLAQALEGIFALIKVFNANSYF